jgi:hypothetical protein
MRVANAGSDRGRGRGGRGVVEGAEDGAGAADGGIDDFGIGRAAVGAGAGGGVGAGHGSVPGFGEVFGSGFGVAGVGVLVAATALGLDHVTAVCARSENFRPQQRSTTVVSRALGPVATFIAQAGHLCAKAGRLLAMKGRDPAAELVALPPGWRLAGVERLHIPGLPDERHLVILEPEG